MKKRN
jgi:transposase